MTNDATNDALNTSEIQSNMELSLLNSIESAILLETKVTEKLGQIPEHMLWDDNNGSLVSPSTILSNFLDQFKSTEWSNF